MYHLAIAVIHWVYCAVGGFLTASQLCMVSPAGNNSFTVVVIVGLLLTKLLMQYVPTQTFLVYWAACGYWLVVESTSFGGSVITAWLIMDFMVRLVIQWPDLENSEENSPDSAPVDNKTAKWRRSKFAQNFIRSFPPSNTTMSDLPHNFEKNNHEED